ncbi:MAG: hypothetical protein GZ085_10020 [Sulfuriferula multivorans]|uniref:Uncharacterized protein n=1 Tax=Sulfuriferula multivorans TaxID=1559896 RepID=A0A7C9P796_9PROT|nr:hypothetical protein [Sulfuriferula multivorans]
MTGFDHARFAPDEKYFRILLISIQSLSYPRYAISWINQSVKNSDKPIGWSPTFSLPEIRGPQPNRIPSALGIPKQNGPQTGAALRKQQ